jgi:hypothetical protein
MIIIIKETMNFVFLVDILVLTTILVLMVVQLLKPVLMVEVLHRRLILVIGPISIHP